jgi:hypothetical protein
MRRPGHGIVAAAVAIVLSVSVLGCTGGRPGPSRADLQADTEASSGAGSSGSGGTGEDAGGGVPGAPVGPENRENQPQALGAPIKVPRFQQIGAPIGEVFGSLEAEFVAACGGSLCVKLVIQPADADPQTCGFAGTDPPAGTTVERDTTVALLCNPAPTESTDTTSTDTTPDSTGPTDSTQPDATTGTGDSQPTDSS